MEKRREAKSFVIVIKPAPTLRALRSFRALIFRSATFLSYLIFLRRWGQESLMLKEDENLGSCDLFYF